MATKLKKTPRWKVAVEVTTGGIKLGKAKGLTKCPIARALKYLKYTVVNVEAEEATFTYKGKDYRAALPKAAINFIARYDEGKTVKPLTFSIYPELY